MSPGLSRLQAKAFFADVNELTHLLKKCLISSVVLSFHCPLDPVGEGA